MIGRTTVAQHEAPVEIVTQIQECNSHDISQHYTECWRRLLECFVSKYRLILPVHICHIMTKAPLMGAGAHSAPYTGTVVDLDPIPRPRTNLAMNKFTHEFATPSQIEATAAMKQEMKIVPRRPSRLLRGAVSQQPRMAHAR